ncbi:MAG TPA: hypothetical protein VEC13_01675 [Candidatus Paceibacterota bacterium]|nr:hypothetical protein [Candidatus Paceibacterota bacterium]
MYVIEFKDMWIKREGGMSLCHVLKDAQAEREVSELLEKYVEDIAELINVKLAAMQDMYKIPENEIKRVRELVEELRQIEGMRCKEQ